MSDLTRRLAGGLALAALAVAPAFAAQDPGHPGPVEGYVTIVAHSADLGVGYTWGDGTLRWHHRTYHFSVKGVNVAAVGYSTIVGHGRVYNLHRLGDFDGTYASSTGEATIVNGIGGQALVNTNGVQLRIDNVTRGARLSGSADGIQLELRR